MCNEQELTFRRRAYWNSVNAMGAVRQIPLYTEPTQSDLYQLQIINDPANAANFPAHSHLSIEQLCRRKIMLKIRHRFTYRVSNFQVIFHPNSSMKFQHIITQFPRYKLFPLSHSRNSLHSAMIFPLSNNNNNYRAFPAQKFEYLVVFKILKETGRYIFLRRSAFRLGSSAHLSPVRL